MTAALSEARRTRVLLVDDNAHLRELFRIGLEAIGRMEVVGEAADGAAGLAAARALRPDVVLLDLSMPTMDGLEAVTYIRHALPATHVVILTGFRQERLGVLARELGATGFLEKGLTPTELAAAVRAIAAEPAPPFQALPPGSRAALLARVNELV